MQHDWKTRVLCYKAGVPRASTIATKEHRLRVGVPGLLMLAALDRAKAHGYPGFSPSALELICCDLRFQCVHDLTLLIAKQPAHIQHAIDCELFRQRREGAERCGPLMQVIQGTRLPPVRLVPRGDLAVAWDHVRFSDTLAPCIKQRVHQAGYKTFSAYVTALVRYDLLLLGQHLFNGADKDPDILAALDQETRRTYNEGRPRRSYLRYRLEDRAGRKLSDEEARSATAEIYATLEAWALAANKEERR